MSRLRANPMNPGRQNAVHRFGLVTPNDPAAGGNLGKNG
jgi:hypothetical protein